MTGRSALTVAFNNSSLLIHGVIWNGFLFINEAFFPFRCFTKSAVWGFETVWTEMTQIMGPGWNSVAQVSEPGVAPLLPTQPLQAGGSVNLVQNLAQFGVFSFVLPWRIFPPVYTFAAHLFQQPHAKEFCRQSLIKHIMVTSYWLARANN